MKARKRIYLSDAATGWMPKLLSMRVNDPWTMPIGGNNPTNGRAAIKRLRKEHPEYAHLVFKTATDRIEQTFTITRKEDRNDT